MQVILWHLIAPKVVRMFLEIGDLGNPLIQVGFDPLLSLSIGEARNRQGFGKKIVSMLSLLVVSLSLYPSFLLFIFVSFAK